MPEVVSNTSPLQYLHQIGLLGILLKAKKAGLIHSVLPPVINLEEKGFRLSPSTRKDFLALAGQ